MDLNLEPSLVRLLIMALVASIAIVQVGRVATAWLEFRAVDKQRSWSARHDA